MRVFAVLLLALLGTAAPLGSGPVRAMGQPATGEDAGEAAYREACASCHRTPARFMRRYLDLSAEDRRAALDSFLRTHYAPDDAKRAAIIAWLEAHHTRR